MEINDILNLIETVKLENIKSVWCPSLNKDIEILPLNAEHHKMIVKSLVDSPFFSSNFNVVMYNILNSVIKNVESLNVLDKQFILLSLRSNNISNDYSLPFTTKDGTESSTIVNLHDHLQSKSHIKNIDNIVHKLDENYTVEIGYPTLLSEYNFESFINKQITSIDQNDQKEIKNTISQLFLTNILSYVKSVTIKDSVIPFDALNMHTKLTVGLKLPSTLTQFIIDKIDQVYGKNINDVLAVEFTENGESYKEQISIDSSFFMN